MLGCLSLIIVIKLINLSNFQIQQRDFIWSIQKASQGRLINIFQNNQFLNCMLPLYSGRILSFHKNFLAILVENDYFEASMLI